MEFGALVLSASPFQGRRRVIDISGDGANNNGAPVLGVWARAIRRKMILEIAGRGPKPRLIPASSHLPGKCMDGEWKLRWDLEDM